ncbi:hypothetical protein HDK90DRAFT_556639 [Phyllosticta capitalensis]|uniref:Uncharacterized protein n=1 Tax=Phyllosticta capitalensis TaxID=121624 RepID=A0ABR1YIN2_9PEZI
MAPPPDSERPYKRRDFCNTQVGFVVEGRLHIYVANPADIGNHAPGLRKFIDKYLQTGECFIDLGEFVSIYADEKAIIEALLSAIKSGKFETPEPDVYFVQHIIAQIIIYNFAREIGCTRLQEAAVSNFKRLLDEMDPEEELCFDAGDDMVKFLYGAAPDSYANLPPEKDQHGLRDFFAKNHLPKAHRYLSRYRTEKLIKKVPAFAVDFALSWKPNFPEYRWLQDDGLSSDEENSGPDEESGSEEDVKMET